MRRNTGVSLGVAALMVVFFVGLPALIVILVYTFITIYAVVKAIGSAPQSANPFTVLLGVTMIVTFLTVLLAVAVAVAGRAIDPKPRPLIPAFLRRK